MKRRMYLVRYASVEKSAGATFLIERKEEDNGGNQIDFDACE